MLAFHGAERPNSRMSGFGNARRRLQPHIAYAKALEIDSREFIQGLKSETPVEVKSAVLRVTTVMP